MWGKPWVQQNSVQIWPLSAVVIKKKKEKEKEGRTGQTILLRPILASLNTWSCKM
jgi:hypothetical protein